VASGTGSDTEEVARHCEAEEGSEVFFLHNIERREWEHLDTLKHENSEKRCEIECLEKKITTHTATNATPANKQRHKTKAA
jgi:DNA replication protein DnaC